MEKEKILIIEDDKAISKLYEKHLSSKDYAVFTAFNGKEGLEKVKTVKPDLILLDIVMPIMDGITVLKNLKKNPEAKNIPVIMLTVLEKSESISQALEAGITHYLVKSNYSVDELGRKVDEILKQENANDSFEGTEDN